MDSVDPSSETYRLWRIFTNPATGEKAVAMTATQANAFISVYTILIGLIVATTWGILISFTILFLSPRKMTRTTYIAVITTWSQSEPWSASMVLGEHSWRVFRGALTKKHPTELTWKAFWFDMALLAVAVITGGGGFALGPLFSSAFTVGNIAPVNPDIVYLPLYTSETEDDQRRRLAVDYDSIAALKAFGSVDSAEASSQDTGELVDLSWDSVDLSEAIKYNYTGEDRYSVQYHYKVTGSDMGLQKLRDLTLEVSGNCTFQDTWWYTSQGKYDIDDGVDTAVTVYDVYINWEPATLAQYLDIEQLPFDYNTLSASGNDSRPIYIPLYSRSPPAATFYIPEYSSENRNLETGRSYFVVYPLTGRAPTVAESTDPWYATEDLQLSTLINANGVKIFPYMVKSRRPPLLCQENNDWSSGSWKGKMKNLLSTGNDGPPVTLPAGMVSLFQTGLGAFPMMVTLGRALSASSLRSATHLIGEEKAIDTESARARDDMKRLVQASYLATRDIFRNSALAGSALKADISSGKLKNAMRDLDTGEPIPGTGDFVITSNAVQALSLSALISIPCILVVITAIALLLQAGRKVKARNVTSKPLGRVDRYIGLVTGLKASQLYRIVDQLLADRAPSDKEGWDGNSHRSQAQWKNQTGEFPFIASNTEASPNDPIIIPQFHVQVKGKDRRLTLDVPRIGENVGHWRSLTKGDGRVKLSEVDRQVGEEQEYRGSRQPTAPIHDRVSSNGSDIEKALPTDLVKELQPSSTDIGDEVTELGA